jgi:hypothetical protein
MHPRRRFDRSHGIKQAVVWREERPAMTKQPKKQRNYCQHLIGVQVHAVKVNSIEACMEGLFMRRSISLASRDTLNVLPFRGQAAFRQLQVAASWSPATVLQPDKSH